MIGAPPSGEALDLGSGGGLPGLVLALGWPSSRWLLLDGRAKAAGFLREAVRSLGSADRVVVIEGRAEEVAHHAQRRGRFSLVVARAVGPAAVTAELAAGFLSVGGRLLVSEPPGGDWHRWEAERLSELGMGPPALVAAEGSHFAVVAQATPCPPRFPRRTGIPAKRPLF